MTTTDRSALPGHRLEDYRAVARQLERTIDAMRALKPPSRPLAVAITEAETALLWLREATVAAP